MSKTTFKRTLRRRAGFDRPERKPLPVLAPPLRREYTEPSDEQPTDEQLARFMAVSIFEGPAPPVAIERARMALKNPATRASWQLKHLEFQRRFDEYGETDPRTEPSREDGGRKP